MQSDYASLSTYYKNQSEGFEYSSQYNVGKFDIVKYNDGFKFQIINIDSSISSMPTQPAGIISAPNDGQLILNADKLPNNFEIKSFDIFNNENGVWIHNTNPIAASYTNSTSASTNRYIHYDNVNKLIYIGSVPTTNTTLPAPPQINLQASVFKVTRTAAPTVVVSNDNKIVGKAFARVYITW